MCLLCPIAHPEVLSGQDDPLNALFLSTLIVLITMICGKNKLAPPYFKMVYRESSENCKSIISATVCL
jgi:hypothetical protein